MFWRRQSSLSQILPFSKYRILVFHLLWFLYFYLMGNFTIVILVSGNIGTVPGPFSVHEVVHKVDLILMYFQNIQH